MLSLSVLAARCALRRGSVASRCVPTAARSLGCNVSVVATGFDRLQVSHPRAFSTLDGPDDEAKDKDAWSLQDEAKEQDAFDLQDKDQNQDTIDLQDEDQDEQDPINGEMSPLERLMQHSQDFELDMEAQDGDDSEDEGDDPFASSWGQDGSSKSQDSSHRTSATFKRNTFRRRGSSVHHSVLGRMAVNNLVEKDMDELDYEAELEGVWDQDELKQRKFHQALRRELDRDRVCTNCGERGHRARNCLVPRICSNCGNLGHSANQCKYRRSPETVDEFLLREQDIQQKRKQSRKLRKKAAKAALDPSLPRSKDVPTSDFNKRNESLRQELDAELDAYADMLEERARKRKEHKQKEAQSGNSTPTPED